MYCFCITHVIYIKILVIYRKYFSKRIKQKVLRYTERKYFRNYVIRINNKYRISFCRCPQNSEWNPAVKQVFTFLHENTDFTISFRASTNHIVVAKTVGTRHAYLCQPISPLTSITPDAAKTKCIARFNRRVLKIIFTVRNRSNVIYS